MTVYAVIDSRDEPGQLVFGDVLDRQAAERQLRDIVGDEPGWKPCTFRKQKLFCLTLIKQEDEPHTIVERPLDRSQCDQPCC